MAVLMSPATFRPNTQALGAISPYRKAPLSVAEAAPVFGCQPKATPAKPQIDAIPGNKKLGTLQKWCLQAIQWYQKRTRWVGKNGETASMFPCPYGPSCSKYTFNAIAEFGVVKGILMGAYRIFFKCNPVTVLYKVLHQRIKTGKWPGKLADPMPPVKSFSDFWNLRTRLRGAFNDPLPKACA